MDDRSESGSEYRKERSTRAENDHPVSDAAALADDLGYVDVASVDETGLCARIAAVTDVDESTVAVWYRLPHDVYERETFEKPIPWSDRFRFARLVSDLGYSASSIDEIEGEEIVVDRTAEGDWQARDQPAGRHEVEPMWNASPVTGVGFGIAILYLLVLLVTTAGTTNVTGALTTTFLLGFVVMLLLGPP